MNTAATVGGIKPNARFEDTGSFRNKGALEETKTNNTIYGANYITAKQEQLNEHKKNGSWE